MTKAGHETLPIICRRSGVHSPMSAAEPAQPDEQPTVNTTRPAPVIHLNHRRHRGGGQPTVRGQRRTMDTTQPPAHGDQPADRHQPAPDVLHAWSEKIEMSFLETGQSLTDPRTAAAYQTTLDVWETVLKGSHARGIIDADQLRKLTETLYGMRQAPRLI